MQTSGFFKSKLVDGEYDRAYDAEQFAQYFKQFIGNGIYVGGTSLMVTANSGMKVNITIGSAFINGYWFRSDEIEQLQLANADGIQNRIDAVVLRWSSIDRNISLVVKQGTLSSSPAYPSMDRTDDCYELCLAYIYVAKGATAITQTNITDTRLNANLCGVVGALVEQWDMTQYGAQLEAFTEEFEETYTNQITAWIEEVRQIVEENELDLTAVAANIVDLQNADKNSEQFTFIVDSSSALEAWRTSAVGNDYSRVLIKNGTYNLSDTLDLSTTGTKYVKGEPQAILTFTKSSSKAVCYGTEQSKNSDSPILECVAVQLIGSGAYGFYGFTDLRNCKVTGTGNANFGFKYCYLLSSCSTKYITRCFENCNLLNGCYADGNFENSDIYTCCYHYCDFLTGCYGVTKIGDNENIFRPVFQYCNYVVGCNAELNGGRQVGYYNKFGYLYCTFIFGCKGITSDTDSILDDDLCLSVGRDANYRKGKMSFAFGEGLEASGTMSYSFGSRNNSRGEFSVTMGETCGTSEYSKHCVAIGSNCGTFETADDDSSDSCIAMGYSSSAAGNGSIALGMYAVATGEEGGNTCVAIGKNAEAKKDNSVAIGNYAKSLGENGVALGYTEANKNQTSVGYYNNKNLSTGYEEDNGDGTVFVVGKGYKDSSNITHASNAMRIIGTGNVLINGSYNTSGADYAEYFEWEDGNEKSEDRRGYFVTMVGEKITKAKDGDYILGIVSGNPSIIGNSDEHWRGQYATDEFGAYIYDIEKVTDEKTGEEKEIRVPRLNKDYDESVEYICRAKRKEWDAIGMMGVLSVKDDGTCKVNGFCKCNDDGIATESDTGYRVIGRVSETIVKLVLK